jgi:D-alanine-D-alanine ligase-like ATP-grasp enzyme
MRVPGRWPRANAMTVRRWPGGLICLEVNTRPGMIETSLAPDIVGAVGFSCGELV